MSVGCFQGVSMGSEEHVPVSSKDTTTVDTGRTGDGKSVVQPSNVVSVNLPTDVHIQCMRNSIVICIILSPFSI